MGKSINQIVEETGFSKASVSLWVRDITLSDQQKRQILKNGRSVGSIEKRRVSRLVNENKKRQRIIGEAKRDFHTISIDQLKLIGAILYLGEGGKTRQGIVRIANSDPFVIKIMMNFFRNVCNVPEGKFRLAVHTFAHADVNKTEEYWSNITKVPRSQFHKTYIKPSSASLHKRDTLPFGTVDIYVCDTKLFLTIMGWIDKIKLLAS